MVWSRPILYAGVEYRAGEAVPESLTGTKLRNFWEAKRVEMKDFDQSTGRRKQKPDAPKREAEPKGDREPAASGDGQDAGGEAPKDVALAVGRDSVRDAVAAVVEAKGKKAAVEMLKEFGVKSIRDLKDEQLVGVVAKATELLKTE